MRRTISKGPPDLPTPTAFAHLAHETGVGADGDHGSTMNYQSRQDPQHAATGHEF